MQNNGLTKWLYAKHVEYLPEYRYNPTYTLLQYLTHVTSHCACAKHLNSSFLHMPYKGYWSIYDTLQRCGIPDTYLVCIGKVLRIFFRMSLIASLIHTYPYKSVLNKMNYITVTLLIQLFNTIDMRENVQNQC